MAKLILMVDDITTLDVDFIVNAAKPSLLGGGGVDGAIHRAAGPKLLEACRKIAEHGPNERCPTGGIRMTPGYNLPAKNIIHTVGPVYDEHTQEKACSLLHDCYSKSCERAYIRTPLKKTARIAFPCISTGVYGFPKMLAASIALLTCVMDGFDLEVIFCCFCEEDAAIYEAVSQTMGLTLERI